MAVLSLLNTDWYVRGIIRRPIYQYDAAKGPAIYRDGLWDKPSGSPIRLTLAGADSIPDYVLLRQPMQLRKAGLTAIVSPETLPRAADGSGILERKDIAVLRMIADSWPQRPIYFSRTTVRSSSHCPDSRRGHNCRCAMRPFVISVRRTSASLALDHDALSRDGLQPATRLNERHMWL